MVKTVLEHEHVLLSEQEIDALDCFRKFCCKNTCTIHYISLEPFNTDNTRYCLVRLVLRKPNQWHAISALQSFVKEVGEEGLESSIADLCQPINYLQAMDSSKPDDPLVKREFVDPDIPFLPTYAHNAEAGPSRLPAVPVDSVKAVLESNPAEMNLGFFCEDENNMTLEDILGRLHKNQLLELVKSTRCKLPSRPKVFLFFLLAAFLFLLMFLQKADIIASLQRTAASQSILTQSMSPICKGKGKSKSRDDDLHQATLFPFLSIGCRTGKFKTTQENRLRQMALKLLGMLFLVYYFTPFYLNPLPEANVFASILIFID